MSNVECNLSPALKPRHVTMLSIAGVIGAGLFVGSGHAIAAAGPAVLLAYAMAGTLVVLVMRMLGVFSDRRAATSASRKLPPAMPARATSFPQAARRVNLDCGGTGCCGTASHAGEVRIRRARRLTIRRLSVSSP